MEYLLLFCALFTLVHCAEIETCNLETFKASCPNGKTIKIQSAFYGRGSLGRCVRRDFGYVGCSADASDIVADECDGRESCSISLPNPALSSLKPCPQDLPSHLFTNYVCVESDIQMIKAETCASEVFEPSCPAGKVIRIREAKYGRPNIGRCVRKDFGYVGCLADASIIIADECDGRESCSISLPNPALSALKPCPQDFTSHLFTTYVCIESDIPFMKAETCASEVFEPSCTAGKVIRIREAKYGRPNIGRCVRTDYGYIGCSADASDIIADECDGQGTCSISLQNAALLSLQPCPQDFTSHLFTTYVCVESDFPIMRAETCESEVFEPNCTAGKVIKIGEAKYGRPNIGRCVRTDLGYVGCSADAINIVADECDGRESCSISLPNPALLSLKPCPQDLTSYLFTTYVCVEADIQIMRAETCRWEVFEPSCPAGKVIRIREAKYGRPNIGRCVKTDYGYVGCSSDARAVLDDLCAGKSSCTVRIPNPRLDSLANGCPEDFTRHLSTEYECV